MMVASSGIDKDLLCLVIFKIHGFPGNVAADIASELLKFGRWARISEKIRIAYNHHEIVEGGNSRDAERKANRKKAGLAEDPYSVEAPYVELMVMEAQYCFSETIAEEVMETQYGPAEEVIFKGLRELCPGIKMVISTYKRIVK